MFKIMLVQVSNKFDVSPEPITLTKQAHSLGMWRVWTWVRLIELRV